MMQHLDHIINIVALNITIRYYDSSQFFNIFATNWPSSQYFHKSICKISRVFRFAPGDFFYSIVCCILMRKTVFLPVALIKRANDENWLRSLAYFVRLKSLYTNNTHYGFSLKSLAEKAKCSTGALSFHLKILLEKKLIRYHSGNITFVGMKKLLELDRKPTIIGVPVDFKNQYDLLRGQIIRLNLSAQKFNICKSGHQMQKLRMVENSKSEMANSCYTGLSAEGVGWLFGLTGATGSRIRKKLKMLGQFRCYPVFSVLYSNVSLKQYCQMKWIGGIPIYSRYIDGDIVIQKRMRMEYVGFAS